MTPHPIRGPRQYEGLRPRSRQAHHGAREVIGFARERRIPIARAITELRSKGIRTSVASVKKYFGNAVEIDWRGRLVATAADPNLRVMNVLTSGGARAVYVGGSRNASLVAKHEAAVRTYLATGDDTGLREWRDRYGAKSFAAVDDPKARVRLETDPDDLDELARRGEVSYEDIYPEVV